MQVAINYDCEIFLSLLLIVYNILITTLVIVNLATFIVFELGVFGNLVFLKEITLGLLKAEFSFFRKIVVPIDAFSPFIWWPKHQQQFPNIGYLTRQVMRIVGSQIEIEIIFSMVGVIIGLKHY
jgi:hypothetical protein